MKSYRVWRSGFVRRWHSNPDMAHTGQTNAQHQWGCAVLAMELFPGEYQLLKACLLHDAGEVNVGDVSAPAKEAEPDLRRLLRRAECRQMEDMEIDYLRHEALKFIDRLEALLWVAHHNRNLLGTDEWSEQREWMWQTAAQLGVHEKYSEIIKEALGKHGS